jgi:hypothetical protein
VKALPVYTKDTDTEANYEMSFNQFQAYMYLKNSDKTKYGSLLKGLETQQSLKNSQYPKTLVEATNVLSNHRFDYASGEKNTKP